MKNALIKLVTGFFIFTFVSCAPVKFYSNPELTKKSGLKYYTVKPYLMVEKELSSGNTLKATIVYMPDLANPQYMVVRDGLGSRKVDLKLTEGSINTISVASDPKIAEMVEAFAALAAKGTAALEDLNALKGLPLTGTSTTITEIYEVVMENGATTFRKVEIK